MQIHVLDEVVRVSNPDYNANNPVDRMMGLVEEVHLAAGIEYYVTDSLQYLFPVEQLVLYGPNQSGPDKDVMDPFQQDNKTDFQKQNIKEFTTSDTYVVRGYASIGNWVGPFLKLSYRGGPDSKLSETSNHQLGQIIKLYLKVQNNALPEMISAVYNPDSDRYEVEIWGYPGSFSEALQSLDDKGKAAIQRGELQFRPNLIKGSIEDFNRENLNEQNVLNIATDHAMHPVLPLHLEVAWSDESGTYWDSQNGMNYHYEFNMKLRGWNHYLTVGTSPNPHGGVGFLEYRNIFSNYGAFSGSGELGRPLESWNLDAFGNKQIGQRYEPFMAVDYMDLHILRPGCGIGLHRHRDNQEAFFLVHGEAYMITGDWLENPGRARALEVRKMKPGDLVLLKNSQMHSLVNTTDENITLLMFGGYD